MTDPPGPFIPFTAVDAGSPGELDVPVLIDLDGHQDRVTGAAPLPLGAVCLTYDKAASVRDDLADKNARVAKLESALTTDWPTLLLVSGVALLAGGAVGVGVICGTGHCR